MTWFFMHDSRTGRKHGGIDFVGILLLAVGLGSLQTLLEKGTREGWFQSNLIIELSAAAVVGLGLFLWWELRVAHPVISLRVLRHRGFAAGTAFGTVVGFGLYGGMFILPVFLQGIRRYTAQQSGIIMLPGAIATAVMMPFVGKLVNRFVPQGLTALGTAGAIISMFMFISLSTTTGPEQLFWPLVLRGRLDGHAVRPHDPRHAQRACRRRRWRRAVPSTTSRANWGGVPASPTSRHTSTIASTRTTRCWPTT